MRLDDRFDELVVEPRRLLPHLVRVRGPRARACSQRLRDGGRRGPHARTALAERTGTDADARPPWAWGADVARPGRARRRPDRPVRRRGRRSCSTPTGPSTWAASSSTPPSAASTSRACWTSSAPGSPLAVAPRPLPGGDRAPHRPGHRRLLPGGPGGAAAARGRPAGRRADRRHPLRRRPLADRDGPALPGHALVGVEFEPDSVARARAHVEEAGLADRITIEQGDLGHVGPRRRGDAGLLPVRAPPARRPRRRYPVRLGRAAAGRLAARARLVPADRPGRAPDAPRRADRRASSSTS